MPQRDIDKPMTENDRRNQIVEFLVSSEDQIARRIQVDYMTPELIIAITSTALSRSPKLLTCNKLSILGTVVQATELGLQLNGFLGEAYMVPFYNSHTRQNEAQLQVGYRGMITLARRSNLVAKIKGELVYEGDEFEVQLGYEDKIHHVPNLRKRGRGKADGKGGIPDLVAGYCQVWFKDGTQDFEVMTLDDLEAIRDRTKSRDQNGNIVGPWITDTAEMFRKVPIRRMAKRLPLSPQFATAATMDEYGEAGIPQNNAAVIDAHPEYDNILSEAAAERVQQLADKYGQPASKPRPQQPSPAHTVTPQQQPHASA